MKIKVGDIVGCYSNGDAFAPFLYYGVVCKIEIFDTRPVYTVKRLPTEKLTKKEIKQLMEGIGGQTFKEDCLQKTTQDMSQFAVSHSTEAAKQLIRAKKTS